MSIKNAMLKSGLVSALTTTLDLLLFVICLQLFVAGSALVLARWACGAIGATANLLLNRRWAFSATGERLSGQALRYTVIALGSVSLATAVWYLLQRYTPLDPRVLHPISLFLVWPVFTFPMLRKWVFSQGEQTVGLR
jgi:putative flippase GtrA